jgi:hypothetical protein
VVSVVSVEEEAAAADRAEVGEGRRQSIVAIRWPSDCSSFALP